MNESSNFFRLKLTAAPGSSGSVQFNHHIVGKVEQDIFAST